MVAPDHAVARFRELIKAKYTGRLTPQQKAMLRKLEEQMAASEEAFYRPILDRVKAMQRP